MRWSPQQWLLAACSQFLVSTDAAKVTNPQKVPKDAVLLSKVESLTVRAGKQTKSRRVSPVPQLQCVGPANVCSLYSIDVMRCTNEGADYDAENVQWSCKASLPEEFKLGSTDVGCEGYASSDDPYVLKGSCGVEYRLILTDKGEAKYGRQSGSRYDDDWQGQGAGSSFAEVLFMITFLFVAFVILRSLYLQWQGRHQQGPRRPAVPWGGFGGGGNDDDDPPPPYDPHPRGYGTSKKSMPRASTSTQSSSSQSPPQQQGWRPGFWTGTAAGAAAGYVAGNRANARARPETTQRPAPRGLFGGRTGGSSWATQPSSSASSPPSYSSSRHESTGFGSTSRR